MEIDISRADSGYFLQQGASALAMDMVSDARQAFEHALRVDPDCSAAYRALLKIRYPGEDYYGLLSRMHRALQPKTYVEIGVSTGASMAQSLPETRCIGIDPNPLLDLSTTHAQIFPKRSDEFFAMHDLASLLGGHPLEFGLIDGMHLFENALEDFVNLERFCSPDATLIFHDCAPFNELTAGRERKTKFWTGDVWRVLPVLAHFRPDLSITMIECVPSGLGVVRGLDPKSTILAKEHRAALTYGLSLDFQVSQDFAARGIKTISNNWDEISEVLI